jgi:ATP-binding cassette subfamily B protein
MGDVFKFVRDKSAAAVSAVLAVISVFAGLIPYLAAAKLLLALIGNEITSQKIFFWGTLAVGGYFFKTLLMSIASNVSHRMAYSTMSEIRTALAQKLLRVPLGTVREKRVGEYKQMLMDEIEHLEYPLAHMIPELTSNLIGFLTVLVYIFIVNWKLGLCAVGTLLVGFVIYGMMTSGHDLMEIFRQFTADSEKMTGIMVEYVGGMEVIKAYGRTASSMEKFTSSVMKFKDSMMTWFRHCYPFMAGFYVVTPNSLLFVLPVGAALLACGRLELSPFIMCMFLAFGVAEPLIKIVEFSDNITAITTTMKKVNEILDLDEMSKGSIKAEGADVLSAENVRFSYKEKEILHGVSFTVKKGEKIAFVGASGSGKSTIAKLLARFYDVGDGSIKLDGTDIRNIETESLMQQMNYVTQDNYLLDMTIADNIRLGDPDATDEQVYDIAKRTGCHDFIMTLPQQYQTRVGSAGAKLSGGQKQRIAIARAMLKNAPIIILDEATAYMDPENEELVQNSINELAKDKTLIMIAHRLQTVTDCDRIYVVNKGEIIAQGTHEELLENSSDYRSMWAHHSGEEA